MPIKLSKAGYDVKTTGNENLSFSSEIVTHSIYNVTTVFRSKDSYTATFSHNLGYVPKVWVYLSSSGLIRIPRIYEYVYPDTSVSYFNDDYSITTTQVIIRSSNTQQDQYYKVIIFTRSAT